LGVAGVGHLLVDDFVVNGGEFGRRGGSRCHDNREKAIFGNEGEFVEKDGSNKTGDGARDSRGVCCL
jgi:hypothetical protein